MEEEIQKPVKEITQEKDYLETDKEAEFELDENQLKKYIDLIVREVKKEGKD
jgi:hypothetical protein